MARPMLGGLELQQAQRIEVDQDRVLESHPVPALETDFLQELGRRATAVSLTGVLTGAGAAAGLDALRRRFRAGEPVPFTADITSATRVEDVLIEALTVRELAGRPRRFEYAFELRELIAPPEVIEEPPEIIPPEPPDPQIERDVGTLVIEVIVEGEPAFDFSRVRVTVTGEPSEGEPIVDRSLEEREGNVWTEEEFPAGSYVATAVAEQDAMTGSEPAVVRPGATTQVVIRLRRGAVIASAFVVSFWFDRAFVEPCQRHVLRRAAERAAANPDEKLVIVGHTDKTGSEKYNQSLSERRARAVFAHLTSGRDRGAAVAELDMLRRRRPSGELPSVREGWGTREYQHILQALGHYGGQIDEDHGPMTDRAVRVFQADRGLPVTGLVDDATWRALLEAYLDQQALAVPESQFLENCPGEILKWVGCGEEKPLAQPQPPTENAFRPYRRAELLFVRATELPCPVPRPDTFDLPAPGAVGADWCVGPGSPGRHCCFTTYDAAEQDKWLVQPEDPGTITVRGSIRTEDGAPVPDARYVLITPGGEFLEGERPAGPDRGRPIPARTSALGTFEHPDKPKGIYTLEVLGPFVARLAEEPVARGTTVCKRLDGSSDLDVIVMPRPSSLRIVEPDDVEAELESVGIGGEFRLSAEIPGAVGDGVVVEVTSRVKEE